ncbi:epoxide hydrolase family protein [Streptomyces sp. 4F14]|uniref:epoxide hydrolase family protein n=1 Tax=Streptomyces sp. 4F14 TaxID=3394380 RepID=UPI003A892B26
MSGNEPLPYTIDVPDKELARLRERLAATRWPDAVADDWSRGTSPSALRELVDHWARHDWKASEARLNRLDHFTWDGIHFVRAGTRGKPPLLLLHGWPDSFLRFERILPLLADDFDLVVPSIPGFGLSERPQGPGVGAARVAELFAGLMERLGLERYGVHGGDCGAQIGEAVARRHGDRVTGLHLTDLPFWHTFLDPSTLDDAERQFLQDAQEWARQEGAYQMVQSSKPQTLAYGLNDSPAGLAAWLFEKYQSWSDGDAVTALGLDAILDNLTLYWVTQTGPSSARYYYENATTLPEILSQPPATVPVGFAHFPADLQHPPRSLVERSLDLQHWADMPSGGHFTAWEAPQPLADDLRAFFGNLA